MMPDEYLIPLIHRLYALRVPPRRQITVLLYLSGYNHSQIGALLGITRATVKLHWSLFLERDLKATFHLAQGEDRRINVLRYLLGLPAVVEPLRDGAKRRREYLQNYQRTRRR